MFARRGVAVALVVGAGLSTAVLAGSVSDLSACGRAQEQKKFDEGIDLCTRALAARGINASDQAFALQRRGRIFFAQRKYDEAIADFSEVIRLKPGFASRRSRRWGASLRWRGRGKATGNSAWAWGSARSSRRKA